MKKKIATLILLVIMILMISTFSFADVGSFDRYDSGSSWSSSDWGSSSSWDWDDTDDLLGFTTGYVAGTSSSSSSSYIFWLIIIIVISVVSIIRSKMGKNKRNINFSSNTPVYNNNPIVDVSQSHIWTERIQQIDPNFSEEKMLSYAKDLFVKLQNAWTQREWEPIRPLETETLFEQHNNQIKNYINTNRINIIDRIAVNYATIYGFRQEGDRDILEVALKATMKDYIIDATTKEVLEGNKTQDRITVYKLTFERKTGVLTEEGTAEVKTTNCPNCGAPTKITTSGKCPYCGSVMTTGANSWVLSGLEPLRK